MTHGITKNGCWTSALVLKLNGQWTYGALANHIWSYAGSGFNDISASFVQPFLPVCVKKVELQSP
jgi:hypothetical protein